MKKCTWSSYLLPVLLGGFVYATAYNATPDSRNFGIVRSGESADQIFTVQNTGDSPLVYSVCTDAPYSIITTGDYRSLNMAAAASSTYSSSWAASNVVYGSFGNWSSVHHLSASQTEWIQLNFEQIVSVAGVRITARFNGEVPNGYPSDYFFEYSTNGTIWAAVSGASYINQPNPTGIVTHIFNNGAVSARYVRMVATKLRMDSISSGYYFQLSEFEPLSASNTYSLASGTSQNITVRYTPLSEGIHTQSVNVISDGVIVAKDVIGTTGLKLIVDNPFGAYEPPSGTNLYAYGASVPCSAVSVASNDGTNYTCIGWTGTGAVPASGNDNKTGLIVLTNLNSSITWNWQLSGDLDSDGIPDTWADQYYGHATGAVASADNDNDGYTAYQEYRFGTDPTNALSRFEFLCRAPVTNNYAGIYFTTATGRDYTVEYRTSLTEGFWQPLVTLPGSGSPLNLKDYNIGQQRFYRVNVNMAE
ncbi:MAG: hypothetical protein HOO88_07490 [Kiritimatiellaceae bacterium]|nr:hypothetical protein [Kiritimatiellaceae bacterium]